MDAARTAAFYLIDQIARIGSHQTSSYETSCYVNNPFVPVLSEAALVIAGV